MPNATRTSFAGSSWAEIQLIATIGFPVGAEIELARLESENDQLSERLETRKVLDRAKGILQRDLGISEEEAYLTIQRQSRQRRRSKREIAEAILLADDLRRSRSSSQTP
jgi:uroporphyrinogen-III synthase